MATKPQNLSKLFAQYDARANPSPKGSRHKESFVGWLRRHGYDPEKVTEAEWLKAFRDRGMSDDEALEYIESIAEAVSMS